MFNCLFVCSFVLSNWWEHSRPRACKSQTKVRPTTPPLTPLGWGGVWGDPRHDHDEEVHPLHRSRNTLENVARCFETILSTYFFWFVWQARALGKFVKSIRGGSKPAPNRLQYELRNYDRESALSRLGLEPVRSRLGIPGRNSESRYSERSLFRKVAIPKGRYSESRYI